LSNIAITFATIVAIVVLFASNRIPVVIVALGTSLALYATGVLDLSHALGGLGDPAVIFIASLFVVSAGLECTGVTAWAGQLLIARAGRSRVRLLIFIMLLVALLTALISVNGAVAALMPVVVVMAIRLGRLDDGLFRLRIRAGSPYVGVAQTAIDLEPYPGVSLIAVQAGDGDGPPRRSAFAENDTLIVRGDAATVSRLAVDRRLAFRSEDAASDVTDTLFNTASGLAEVMIPPRSAFISETVFPGMVTPSGDLVILAVQRRGADLGPSETVLAAGDTLLLQGTWKALDEHLDVPDVLVVDSPELVRRQAVPMGAGAKQAIAVLLAMVLLLATGTVPAAIAGLAAACAMVLLRVVTVEQAYRSINWTTVILIGAMIPLSTAMSQTGAAKLLADRLVGLVGNAGPYALLGGLFLLTAILGQLISNMATALSARPVLMSVTVAAAASFLTPIATPVNLMVMGPGGYEFGDYWKLGLPLMLWFFLVATFIVPVFWAFSPSF
jgi:di/tricarboxylate transporter